MKKTFEEQAYLEAVGKTVAEKFLNSYSELQVLETDWECELGKLDFVVKTNRKVSGIVVETTKAYTDNDYFPEKIALPAETAKKLLAILGVYAGEHGIKKSKINLTILGVKVHRESGSAFVHPYNDLNLRSFIDNEKSQTVLSKELNKCKADLPSGSEKAEAIK